jgi:eukaryotic-like serine/threonine-protein kinase
MAPMDAANSEVVRERALMTHVGRYVLKAPIGDGGLGTVFDGWDPLLSRQVAIKTLQFGLKMSSRIALDRLLLNEARAAAQLSHRHIVAVYDAGLSAHGVYLAMERLKGRDLRQALADGWRPSVVEALRLARRVADALSYAHTRGVIHGDIKPGNIFLTRSGRPKVLDFGIARAANVKLIPDLNGLSLGSPHYMAPEQLLDGRLDQRTDIYSLGVVLYELLAGRKAFPAQSLEALREAVIQGRCEHLSILRPELPAALAELVMQCMAVDPQRRPVHAQALSAALRRLMDSNGAIATTEAALNADGAPAKRRWNWRRAFSGGTLGLLSLGLLGGAQSTSDEPASPVPAARQTPTGPEAEAPRRPDATLKEADVVPAPDRRVQDT